MNNSNTNKTPLQELSPRDKPWDEHKTNAESISNSYRVAGNGKYALRISKCSKQLSFTLQNTDASDTGELVFKLKSALFCRVRLCPVCQWRRSLMHKAKAYQALPKFLTDYPNTRFLFLTLTARNCQLEELRYSIDHLNYAFKKLINRKQFPAIGWIKSIEVTKGKDGTAHPHLHILLAVKKSYFGKNYLSKKQWIKMWKECLKVDYSPSIDVSAIKSDNDLNKVIPEIIKYQTKENDLVTNPEWLQELTTQLHKTRAFATGGLLKEYFKDLENDDGDFIGSDNESVPSEDLLIADWNTNNKQYLVESK